MSPGQLQQEQAGPWINQRSNNKKKSSNREQTRYIEKITIQAVNIHCTRIVVHYNLQTRQNNKLVIFTIRICINKGKLNILYVFCPFYSLLFIKSLHSQWNLPIRGHSDAILRDNTPNQFLLRTICHYFLLCISLSTLKLQHPLWCTMDKVVGNEKAC